ncbi:MAG: hypothetical protein ABSG79_10540 [Bryobacteraceae bacterium]|jgi:hypothetical protein
MMGWSLACVSLACGLAIAWVFRRFTDRAAVRAAGKRLQARVLEMRLYSSEPALMWSAQKALVRDNLRWLALMSRPALVLALPLAWLFVQLDSIYGRSPLAVGGDAVVTVQLEHALEPVDAAANLQAPPEIAVETPPVRIFAERRISWRIRALRPVRGKLRLVLRGHAIEKTIAAGERNALLSPRRERSLWGFLLHPEESRLPAGEAAWVEVDYPPRPWLAWFLAISTAGALGFAMWPGAPL